MRPDVRDAAHLLDMLQYAGGVVGAVEGRTFDDYVAVEDEIVWDVATAGIPELISLLTPLVSIGQDDV
ncbi:MAG: hypothetical protein V2B18_05055 [Pseudomonadota bacterium]